MPPGLVLRSGRLSFASARLLRYGGWFPRVPSAALTSRRGRQQVGWVRAGAGGCAGSLGPRCRKAAKSRALPTWAPRGPLQSGAPEPACVGPAAALQLRPRRPVEGSGAPTPASSGSRARAHRRPQRPATPCPSARQAPGGKRHYHLWRFRSRRNGVSTDSVVRLPSPPICAVEGRRDLGIALKVARQIKCAGT